MTAYLSFLLFAAVIAIAPGPDTFLTLRATVVGGRARGWATAAGIAVAGTIQGVLAATGLGAALAHAEPVFEAIRWAGVAYLVWLGLNAIRDALRRDASVWEVGGRAGSVRRLTAFRQGFVCNITNPKVLAFNLAVLPQFVQTGDGLPLLLTYALTLMAAGLVVLALVVWLAGIAAEALVRPRLRRAVDGGTGVVMLGFATALAVEA